MEASFKQLFTQVAKLTDSFWFPPLQYGPTAWNTCLQGKFPALVTNTSPSFKSPFFWWKLELSSWIDLPPAFIIAPANPSRLYLLKKKVVCSYLNELIYY